MRGEHLAGLRKARALGCAWVEFDVRLTADGAPVVCHDDGLSAPPARSAVSRRCRSQKFAGSMPDGGLARLLPVNAFPRSTRPSTFAASSPRRQCRDQGRLPRRGRRQRGRRRVSRRRGRRAAVAGALELLAGGPAAARNAGQNARGLFSRRLPRGWQKHRGAARLRDDPLRPETSQSSAVRAVIDADIRSSPTRSTIRTGAGDHLVGCGFGFHRLSGYCRIGATGLNPRQARLVSIHSNREEGTVRRRHSRTTRRKGVIK